MKLRNLIVLLVAAAVAACGKPAPQDASELSLTIPFKCNGYVTPLDAASKQTPACADLIIHNSYSNPNDAEMVVDGWKKSLVESEPHQVSVFFYTALTGQIDLGLMVASAQGNAVLDVKIEGKNQRVSVPASTLPQFCYVGSYKISEPGYVRVDIVPVSTSAESYPTISALKVGGEGIGNATEKNEDVIFVTEAESAKEKPHFIRRGPSNHFQWDMPADTEYFYNEVYVTEGEDIPGAYYMLTGGDGFYMGIQPNTKGENRLVLFSVWDTNTEAGDVATLVNKGEQVKSNNYSHEGSGVQNFYYYDWEAGKTYATLVRVRPEVINGRPTGNTLYTGYFRGDEGWVFLAEIRRPGISTYYKGAYSFSENFRPEYGWVPRSVVFPSQWMRDKNGKWHEVLTGRFSCDGTANKGLRRDYEGGVTEDGYFYLRNIGYINENVKYRTPFIRKETRKKPDVDLEALVKLSKSRDGLSK